MKKLLITTALCGLVAAPALAGEPAKVTTEPMTLTLTQMDGVTAAGFKRGHFKHFKKHGGDTCVVCSQINVTNQTAVAVAVGDFATAIASNSNKTDQQIN